MVALKDWLRREAISDVAMAARVGVSPSMVKKLKSGARGPSAQTAARIESVTAGEVRLADLISEPCPATAPTEAVP